MDLGNLPQKGPSVTVTPPLLLLLSPHFMLKKREKNKYSAKGGLPGSRSQPPNKVPAGIRLRGLGPGQAGAAGSPIPPSGAPPTGRPPIKGPFNLGLIREAQGGEGTRRGPLLGHRGVLPGQHRTLQSSYHRPTPLPSPHTHQHHPILDNLTPFLSIILLSHPPHIPPPCSRLERQTHRGPLGV